MNERGSVSPAAVLLLLAILAGVGYFVFQMLNEKPSDGGPAPTVSQEGPENPTPTEETDTPIIKPVETNTPDRPKVTSLPPPRDGQPDQIAGSVRDNFGNVIEGATVQIFEYKYPQDPRSTKRIILAATTHVLHQTVTDENGAFLFKDLVPEKSHYIRASAPNYVTQIKDQVSVGRIFHFQLRKGSRVEVTLKNKNTGEPVVGATVKGFYKTSKGLVNDNVRFRWTEEIPSDDKGRAIFEGAPIAKVIFMVYHPEYVDYREERDVVEGKLNQLDFELDPGVSIKVEVRDKMSEEPLKGVVVKVTETFLPIATYITDEKGQFLATGLKPGTNFFSLQVRNYTSTRIEESVGDDDQWDPEQENLRVFRMEPAGSAAGVVLDPEGKPAGNVKVFAARQNIMISPVRGPAEFVTGADGKFLVQSLDSGATHFLAAHKDGYCIGRSEPITVGPSELRSDVVIQLTRGSTIEGQILNEESIPVAGARLTFTIPGYSDVWFQPTMGVGQGQTRLVVTGEDGRYSLTGLWKGEYKVDITHEKHISQFQQQVRVASADEVVSRDFRMQVGRILAGTVIDESGAPAEGAEVTATRAWSDRAEGHAVVDSEGRFEVTGLTRGDYRLQARKEGYSSEPLERVPADSTNLNLRLVANGGLMGNVVSSKGANITSFTVSMISKYEQTPDAMIEAARRAPPTRSFNDPAGTFMIDDLDPGTYTVTIRAVGHAESITENVQVPSGGPYNMGTVRLSAGATIRGRLVETSGATIRDGLVTLRRTTMGMPNPGMDRVAQKFGAKGGGASEDMGGGGGALPQTQWTGRAEANGGYAITGIPPGEYVLVVKSPRHVVPDQLPLTIKGEEEHTQDFNLELAASMNLKIKDEVGDPITSVSIRVLDMATSRRAQGVTARPSNNLGIATITNLPSGSYRIVLTRTGYIVKELEYTIQAGAILREETVMEKIR